MFVSRYAVLGAALIAANCVATASHADDLWRSIVNLPRSFMPGPPAIIYVGEPQDLTAPGWYKNWLFLRRNSSGAALYNEPCTISNGFGERVVPCQIVAIAESPPGAPLIVDSAVSPVVEGVPVRHNRGHKRHYVALKAKY